MRTILGLIYVSLPVLALFIVVFEHERKKQKTFWEAFFSTLSQLLVAGVILILVAGFIHGLTNGSSSGDVCGYPWDC